jgi:hypothetical protein
LQVNAAAVRCAIGRIDIVKGQPRQRRYNQGLPCGKWPAEAPGNAVRRVGCTAGAGYATLASSALLRDCVVTWYVTHALDLYWEKDCEYIE